MTGRYRFPESTPIWMAALLASQCLANRRGRDPVRWDCVTGRALYTNSSDDLERIEPLGVDLKGGQTLAIWWDPGETAYSLEIG